MTAKLPPVSLLLALAISLGCERPTPPPAEPVDVPAAAPAQPGRTKPRTVIDTHTHLNVFAFELFLKQVEPIGVQRVVNMSGGSSDEIRTQNLAVADRFGGRIALFHNINWEDIDNPEFALREAAALERSVAAGFAGLKVSKALGLGVRTEDGALVAVDDPRLDPIWEKAGALGVPVAIHTSDPKAFFEPPTPENERAGELSLAPGWSFFGDEFPSREALLSARDRLVARHPKTRFILLHFANNPEDVDYVDTLLTAHDNAMVDIAARIGEFGRHDAAKVRGIFERHSDRILFATDLMMGVRPRGRGELRLTLGSISLTQPGLEDIAPFYGKHFDYFEKSGAPIDHPVPIQGEWKVNPLGLSEAVLDKVYWRNAEREIMAPWLGRRAAASVARAAASVAGR